MIRYTHFNFASPPKTGNIWFTDVVYFARIGIITSTPTYLPSESNNDFVVSIVRHPLTWLKAIWDEGRNYLQKVPIAEFANILHFREKYATFDQFVMEVAKEEGIVGTVFNAYKPCSCMRLEDMPFAADEFLSGLGCPIVDACQDVLQKEMINVSGLDKSLRSAICRSESEFCDKYEYC